VEWIAHEGEVGRKRRRKRGARDVDIADDGVLKEIAGVAG
jgi:hypothetical protein